MNSDGTVFRVVEENCWSPSRRIAECDLKGVSIQVLSSVPGIGFNYNVPATDALIVAQFLNDHIAEIVKSYPTRFVGLGTVPLQDTTLAIAWSRWYSNRNSLRVSSLGEFSHSTERSITSLSCAIWPRLPSDTA